MRGVEEISEFVRYQPRHGRHVCKKERAPLLVRPRNKLRRPVDGRAWAITPEAAVGCATDACGDCLAHGAAQVDPVTRPEAGGSYKAELFSLRYLLVGLGDGELVDDEPVRQLFSSVFKRLTHERPFRLGQRREGLSVANDVMKATRELFSIHDTIVG